MQIVIKDTLANGLKRKAKETGITPEAVVNDLVQSLLFGQGEDTGMSLEDAKRTMAGIQQRTKPLDIRAARDEGRA